MTKRLTISHIKETASKKYNLTLVSESYKNSGSPLVWIDNSSGKKFIRSWDNIKAGKLGNKNNNSYLSDKQFIESYANLGYILAMSEDEYNKADRSHSNRIFSVYHESLANIWKTTLPNFKRDAISHINKGNRSIGEIIISSLLLGNGIIFEEQKRVNIKGELHIFDFYIPDYSTFIEYDGEQHFKPVASWGGNGLLEKIKIRDSEKDLYAKETGNKMLRISYCNKTPEEILSVLRGEFNGKVDLTESDIRYNNNTVNIAKYYHNHTSLETQHKYRVSKGTVEKYYKYVYGSPKYSTMEKSIESTNITTGKKEIFKSLREASDSLGVKKENISKVCHGKRNKAGGYVFTYLN